MTLAALLTSLSGIESFLGNYAFPIVCCIAMGVYVYDTNNKHREDIANLNLQHKEEMHDVTNAINNNTLVMQKLCDKLGKEVDLDDLR